MAKYNYYLRDKNATGETPILLFISWNDTRLKFPIKENINPKNWDFENQTIIEDRKNPELREKNRKLTNKLATAKDLFTRFENDNKRQPTLLELKNILEIELNAAIVIEKDISLLNYINKFIIEANTRTNEKTGKPIAKSTIGTYKQVYNMINAYSIKKKKKFTFDDITLDFYFDFHTYLINENLATNTIGKRIAILKTMLREATERGLNSNYAFQSKRFKVTREKTENIYLTETELMEFDKLDLSENKRLDNVRDLFLIGCYTGLRFSDLKRLTKNNIIGENIEIETQKTREVVAIPLHNIVKIILNKHNGALPRAVSNQKMNKYIKEIGQMIESLNINTSKTITKGNIEVTKNKKKYLQITTHTARRSFASNLFVAGVPSQVIMKATGHKTEKSFMQYIKITPKENANIIKLHWEKQKQSKLSVI